MKLSDDFVLINGFAVYKGGGGEGGGGKTKESGKEKNGVKYMCT